MHPEGFEVRMVHLDNFNSPSPVKSNMLKIASPVMKFLGFMFSWTQYGDYGWSENLPSVCKVAVVKLLRNRDVLVTTRVHTFLEFTLKMYFFFAEVPQNCSTLIRLAWIVKQEAMGWLMLNEC